MAKEYGELRYLAKSREWCLEGERFDDNGSTVGQHSATYTSVTIALQVLNNAQGWEVEGAWVESGGFPEHTLARTKPVFLLSRPARCVYK